MEHLRKLFYPLEVRIVKSNPYGLPIGKIFRAKKKREGNTLTEIKGDNIYHMEDDEIEIIKEESKY